MITTILIRAQRFVSEDSDCNGIPDDCFLTNCDISVDLGNGIGADFVLIDELDDPLGRYTLNNNFYMMTTEAQEMFQNSLWDMIQRWKIQNYGDGINHPTYYIMGYGSTFCEYIECI